MRLTLVLPSRRLWRWHLDLVERLRKKGVDLAVVLDDGAPSYGRGLHDWLMLERRRTGPIPLVEPGVPDPSWPALAARRPSPDGILVNLAERDLGQEGGLELRFDGALGSDALVGTLLGCGQPTIEIVRIGHDAVLASSRPALGDRSSLIRALGSCFSRAGSLVLRAVDRVGRDAAPPVPRPAGRSPAAPAGSLPAFAWHVLATKGLDAALRPLRHPDHWTIALRLGGGAFQPIEDDGEHYLADPFLIDWDGRRLLFAESFEHASGRGHIAVAEVHGDRLLAPPVPVLRCPYHLSYPAVFRSDDAFFMIPESGANRSVDLYRADAGPFSWEKVGCLLEGRVFADATPLHHGGLWWLFVSADDHGGATQDELQLYFSEHLTGPYAPHPMNPIWSDCRFARPAGRIRSQGGRLLRPAQDCEANYGAGIAWFEIEELTTTGYRERLLTVWNGPRGFGARGLHSFDQLGDLQAIDLNGPRRRGRLRARQRPVLPRPAGFDAAFLANPARLPDSAS